MKRSNCLLEAIKAKIKDPKRISIHMIPLKLNYNRLHFYWTDSENFYHYISSNPRNVLWFEGVYKVYDHELFNKIMVCRMEQLHWNTEQKVKAAKRLGMKNCTFENL